MSSEIESWVMNAEDIEVITDTTYPPQFQASVRGRVKRRFGRHAGLAHLSVLTVELPPGVATSLRMWQSNEDEFYYVFEGTPTLVTDIGEVILRAGQSVGFPAGRPVGHHLVNRSATTVRLLEVSNLLAEENVSTYTEDDLLLVPSPDRKSRIFVNRRRVPY